MALDLTTLARKRDALEAKLAGATATLRDAQRRDDSRRKLVLGATLMAAVREGAVPTAVVRTLLVRMSAKDRALFERAQPGHGDGQAA